MHGNVGKWCQDWCAAGYGSENVLIDPTGPAHGGRRMLRGGSFDAQPLNRPSAARNSQPDNRFIFAGFRLARTYDISPSQRKKPSKK